jgi:hypothetical protein
MSAQGKIQVKYLIFLPRKLRSVESLNLMQKNESLRFYLLLAVVKIAYFKWIKWTKLIFEVWFYKFRYCSSISLVPIFSTPKKRWSVFKDLFYFIWM